jgi:hypothetical protein
MMRVAVVMAGPVPGIYVFFCPGKDKNGAATTAEYRFPYSNELIRWH